MGGVARRATQIKETRAQARHVLLLDAGNSLVAAPSEAGGSEPAPRTHGQTSVEALNRLGYDAVALGAKDLLLGKAELRKRMAEAEGFSFLSANLKDKATGKLLATPYVIKEVGGHRVALIGITGPVPEVNPEFASAAPLDAARETVQRVRPEASVVILLSNAGAETNKAIAEQVPGIDLIVSGGPQPLPQPVRSGLGALVVQADVSSAYHAGLYLGKLQVEFDLAGTLTDHTWEKVELSPSVADDPDMSLWAASLRKP